MSPPPELSVVLCSLNGAPGVDRCLELLHDQQGADRVQLVVVDDGSTDDTAAVGRARGATVVRHETNRGLAAARNSGVRVCAAPIVAFLDDDCEPEPGWIASLLRAYDEPEIVGAGGPVVAPEQPGFVGGFLHRNNPLGPLDIELSGAATIDRRFALYLGRQWRTQREDRRPVHSLVGANMSFRRSVIDAAGGFDERFTFGAEELDLCLRVRAAHPDGVLLHEPAACVRHSFRPVLRDTMRRSRAYGRGSARMFRKWPNHTPTVFPFPVAFVGLVAASLRRPWCLVAALAGAHAMFPGGVRSARKTGRPAPLLDPYLRLAQEAAENLGFADGLWRFRDLEPMTAPAAP